MYIGRIKLFAKKKWEKELESLIITIRIYIGERGMEFGTGNGLC